MHLQTCNKRQPYHHEISTTKCDQSVPYIYAFKKKCSRSFNECVCNAAQNGACGAAHTIPTTPHTLIIFTFCSMGPETMPIDTLFILSRPLMVPKDAKRQRNTRRETAIGFLFTFGKRTLLT